MSNLSLNTPEDIRKATDIVRKYIKKDPDDCLNNLYTHLHDFDKYAFVKMILEIDNTHDQSVMLSKNVEFIKSLLINVAFAEYESDMRC